MTAASLEATNDQGKAAKISWEKRWNQKAATTIRSQAAKLGWERRQKDQAVAKAAATSEDPQDACLGDPPTGYKARLGTEAESGQHEE